MGKAKKILKNLNNWKSLKFSFIIQLLSIWICLQFTRNVVIFHILPMLLYNLSEWLVMIRFINHNHCPICTKTHMNYVINFIPNHFSTQILNLQYTLFPSCKFPYQFISTNPNSHSLQITCRFSTFLYKLAGCLESYSCCCCTTSASWSNFCCLLIVLCIQWGHEH